MSESERDHSLPASQAEQGRRPYEPPSIAWRENYAPVASGISCIRQPGNPPCNTGPTKA